MSHRCKELARVIFLFISLFFVSSCTTRSSFSDYSVSDEAASDPAVIALLQEHAIPFSTTQPGASLDDLQVLKPIIGGARIVAAGEATHGTHEFFEMKARLFEFLVREMGFTTLAFEVNVPEARLIDDYVQTGEGNPAELLADLQVWPWNTREILNLIRWMRDYNAEPRNAIKVHFVGFDMQLPRKALEELDLYLMEFHPGRSDKRLDCYRAYQDITFGYAEVEPARQKECRTGLRNVYEDLLTNGDYYRSLSTVSAFERALQNARLLLQAEERYTSYANRDFRDRFMAENITFILENSSPSSKMMVWAHNTHVSTALPMAKTMGSMLREQFGKELETIGIAFFQGSFTGYSYDSNRDRYTRLGTQQVQLPPATSYESHLHSAGIPRFFLNMNDLPTTMWFSDPHFFRAIGTAYDKNRPQDYVYLTHLPDEFDLLIYVDETTPSQLLPLN